MKDKKKTIVMFGDSLTDYFPMDKLKDIDAILSTVELQETQLQKWELDYLMTFIHIIQTLSSCKAEPTIS